MLVVAPQSRQYNVGQRKIDGSHCRENEEPLSFHWELLFKLLSQAETERHCLYEECFNGDGAVVSYLNNVRRTKETTMNLCHEAVDVADRQWTRKFVQEPADHKDVAAPDDLSVVLGFTQMLSGGGNEDEVSRLATDHGWLDASGQLTAAGDQLARALLQQSGTRTIFRVW
jgi:hypothetical protein